MFLKMANILTGIQCKHRRKNVSGKESSAVAVVKKNQINSTLFDNQIWLKSVEQKKAIMS